MLIRKRKPTAPGELLLEHYLEPRSVSIQDFAEAVGYSRKHISNVIHGRARIDAVLATHIGEVLGTSAQMWLNAQNAVDLWEASRIRWTPTRRYSAELVKMA